MRILIVEDEMLIAMFLESVVTEMGHAVLGVAVSSDEAIAETEIQAPDFALMDLRLARGTSGVTAAERLWHAHGVRCLFLSANLDAKTVARLEPLRPLGFVGKPVLPSVLKGAIMTAVTALGQPGS